MLVFIVFHDSHLNGDVITREVINVYNSLEKAQNAIHTKIMDILKYDDDYHVDYINEKTVSMYKLNDIKTNKDLISLYIETHNLY